MLALEALRHSQLLWLKGQGQHPPLLGCGRMEGEQQVQSSPGPQTKRTGVVLGQTVQDINWHILLVCKQKLHK